ncbi:CPBP family intramembrane glutamic endopeptidase [Bradyrhizobium sp. STM 3809]|uniref:CPBP family intramembrane glutamic endopeptidase n=1 Tax=Bradyrhizobium sp. STM 3809 TaxID=551936 RepID=UPI001F0AB6DC|nr:CPBP family intramembrane glutamic endopeptidase [Bradyrhizobium sp. STM 3809]
MTAPACRGWLSSHRFAVFPLVGGGPPESKVVREIGRPGDKAARLCALAWLLAVVTPLIASQLIRLHQHGALGWIAWDYAGRLAALAIAAAIPAARAVAFRSERVRISIPEIGLWIAGLSVIERVGQPLRVVVNAAFPGTVFGSYPRPSGWLYMFDLIFGLALVALIEEIVFRRCLGEVLRLWLGGRGSIIVVSSLLFGACHWWTGLGNVMMAALIGAGLMLMLQRSVALWPVVLAHDLVDLVAFA